jgi:hypothetical protein
MFAMAFTMEGHTDTGIVTSSGRCSNEYNDCSQVEQKDFSWSNISHQDRSRESTGSECTLSSCQHLRSSGTTCTGSCIDGVVDEISSNGHYFGVSTTGMTESVLRRNDEMDDYLNEAPHD